MSSVIGNELSLVVQGMQKLGILYDPWEFNFSWLVGGDKMVE